MVHARLGPVLSTHRISSMHHCVHAPHGLHRLTPVSLALVLALHSQAWAQTEGAAAPTLPAIVVKGQAPEATTEGNGSYTTGRAGTAPAPCGAACPTGMPM